MCVCVCFVRAFSFISFILFSQNASDIIRYQGHDLQISHDSFPLPVTDYRII